MNETQAIVEERSGQESVPGSSRRVERAVSGFDRSCAELAASCGDNQCGCAGCRTGLDRDRDQTQGHSYIVAVDNLGKVVSQGTAVQASVADDRLKRAALWSWVQDWRMVSSDATVEKNAVERVYAEIGNGTPAAIKISDGYRDGSPLKLAQTETVSVNVRALYASSKDSFEVEWTETTFDLKGEQTGSQNYKGIITISIHPPRMRLWRA